VSIPCIAATSRGGPPADWDGRDHLFPAAEGMHRILIDAQEKIAE
jgi:hypothetical protein